MSKWSDSKWIRDELRRKWDSGAILRTLLCSDDLFPLTLSLKKPKSVDMSNSFSEVREWAEELRANCTKKIGYGFNLIDKEIVHRQLGRNVIPTHAQIPTIDDALKLIKKTREADDFRASSQLILSKFPQLTEWVQRYPLKVLRHKDDWAGILAVLNWFSEHPSSGLYMRQMDIIGIDTKFVEKRKGILAELLDRIFPANDLGESNVSFEMRYGLREKPIRIRMRFLDSRLFLHGLSDITAPVDRIAAYEPDVSKVFITENEINGLTFPDVKNSVVIFGLGYGVDVLKTVKWLVNKEVYYWGDIDTHGFAILDKVRGFIPKVKSILMTEDVLLSNRNLWVVEEKPFLGELSRLTDEEDAVFHALRDNNWGEKIRLEQERISYGRVRQEVTANTHTVKRDNLGKPEQ